jgi:membrane-associated phospholipid phosphatase
MNATLARIFSTVFHPIFMPLFTILTILYAFPFRYQYVPDKIWNITIFILLGLTMVMPAITIFIMKKLEIVSDYDISEQKQRILPYLIFFFFYLLTFLQFRPKEISSNEFMEDALLAAIFLGATLSLAFAFFLNNFLKVSVHTLAVTNLFTFICLISRNTQKSLFILLIISSIIVGLVGSSRIFLRAHTKREVYVGFICGIIGQVLAFFLYFETAAKI